MHRKNNFDLIRLSAALLVIFGHSYAVTATPTAFSYLGATYGAIGIQIFFAISGYLIAKSWLSDPAPIRFFIRRALRIMPGLTAAILFSALVLGPLFTTLPLSQYFNDPLFWSYFWNIRLFITYGLPGVFAGNPLPHVVNGAIWSIPVEVSLYVLLPIAIVFCSLIRAPRAALLVLSLSAIGACLVFTKVFPAPAFVLYGVGSTSWLETAPFFFAGSCFGVLGAESLLDWRAALLGAVMAPAIPVTGAAQQALAIAVLPYVTLSLAVTGPPVTPQVIRRGDLSYGAYLYGWPMQQAVASQIGTTGGAWLNFTFAALLSLALAFMSWHLIEKPSLAWKPRRKLVARGEPISGMAAGTLP